jgi:hypothetical protein
MFVRRSALLAAMLIPTLLCCSCGKRNTRQPVFPVQGKVLFEGRPLAHAFLVFHPVNSSGADARRPVANAEEDGSFAPSTYDAGDGAPAGEYAVTVEWYQPPTNDQVTPSANLLPRRYSQPSSTPFKVHIAAGENNLEPFQIKRQ